jgi:hypothetical protein
LLTRNALIEALADEPARLGIGNTEVQTSVTQFDDTSLDRIGLIEAPKVHVRPQGEDGLTVREAHELAAAIISAAEELEGLTDHGTGSA